MAGEQIRDSQPREHVPTLGENAKRQFRDIPQAFQLLLKFLEGPRLTLDAPMRIPPLISLRPPELDLRLSPGGTIRDVESFLLRRGHAGTRLSI